jgi:transcriptional regulator with XRE-family HTH domain
VPFNQPNGTHVLDAAYLHRQMGLRGINASELADASGLTQATLSRISRGYVRARPRTLAKIAKGLLKFPVLEGADLLLAAREGNGHEDKMVSGTHPDQPSVVPVRKARRPLWPDEGTPPEFVDGLPVIEDRMVGGTKKAARSDESIAVSAPGRRARRSGVPHKPAAST